MAINIKSPPDHNTLYQIAEQQAGYFTTAQASVAGFTRPLIAYHVRKGQFQRIKHGIYRLVRFPEMPQADLSIALLEVGPQAVISHDSALALYDLSDSLPGAIHLTVPRTSSRRHPELRLHTSRLSRDEVTQRGGLPVTTVTRTLVDLITGHWPEEQILQAIQEAVQHGLVTRKGLSEYAERRGGQVDQFMHRAVFAKDKT